MSKLKLAILNYGIGNIRSLRNALDFLNFKNIEITHLSKFKSKSIGHDILIIPGVGSYPAVMQAIQQRGLDDFAQQTHADKIPIIGICSGMQILSTEGTENGGALGLNLIKGRVIKMKLESSRLPQTGFNEVIFDQKFKEKFGFPNSQFFYFLNSFYFEPERSSTIRAEFHYGKNYPAIINEGSIWGMQFHPEKSNFSGLNFLKIFINNIIES